MVPVMSSEVEVARPVIAWLESEGWVVYQEVSHEGRVADIVGTRGPDTWIVEVKKHRSAALIDQAKKWRGEANSIWVAALKPQREPSEWWDIDLLLYGLGEFTVDEHGTVDLRRSPTRVRLTDLGIRSALNEAQTHFAEAGNAKSERWSPFQALARALHRVVDTYPGVKLSSFVETGDHHYSSDEIAVHCLKQSIQQGTIKGLVVRSGKVYPEGFDRHRYKQQEGA